MCPMLDIRFRDGAEHFGGPNQHSTKQHLLDEWQKWKLQPNGDPRPQPTTQGGSSKLCDFFEDDEDGNAPQVNDKDELEIYPEGPAGKRSEIPSILEWWKDFSTRTPNLARMVRQ